MSRTEDTLRDLIRSTREFYERFNLDLRLEAMVPVFQEEAAELIEAAVEENDKLHAAEEAADVMVTAIGICLALGVDEDTLIQQAKAVIAKNDAKTHETHAINPAGKIARKQP